jgi:2,6-dihydroxypyridine 3-monooxygenase
MVAAELVAGVRAAAARELHPRFVELVERTPEPFIQMIIDVAVPRMAFGRACLLGDAAFVLRPHAAAATAKAAADATALASALTTDSHDPLRALRIWETSQVEHGHRLVNHGVALGESSVQWREASASPRDVGHRLGDIAQPQRRG